MKGAIEIAGGVAKEGLDGFGREKEAGTGVTLSQQVPTAA